jgi:peptidyl-tRNA hydrolase
VGIAGPGREGRDLKEYVLEPMGKAEQQELSETAARAADALECLLTKGVEQAMNGFN